MKKIYFIPFLLIAVLFSSCRDSYTEIFKANSPVYMSYTDLRSAVKTSEPVQLKAPGKIYFKDDYLFIVEKLKGIHVYDLSNPSTPKNVRFITVPGCVDIAIKNNILYADSYVDLVAIDVADISAMKEVNRVKDALPYTVPPVDNTYRYDKIDQSKGVVTGWEVKTVKNELDYQPYPVYPIGWHYNTGMYSEGLKDFSAGVGNTSGGVSSASFGKGGSMARFGLYDKYLYVVDRSSVYTFNTENPVAPSKIGSQPLSWNVETMFLYDDHMFIGTTNGMIICSLENPVSPKWISSYSHVTSCDPVVVENGYAYVTMRSGVTCRGVTADINRMDVLKLSTDYKTITLTAQYNTTNPHGLGIDGNTLFLCDGTAGLKVFDCSDKTSITNNLIAQFPAIQAYDVIPLGFVKRLFMVGEGGFYLYDYADVKNIKLLSKIEVANNTN